MGGQDYPDLTNSNNDGTEAVDYYLRNLPYRLVGETNDPNSTAHYDGTYNFIPDLRQAHQDVWPKRFYYFLDFGSPTCYWGPHREDEWDNWYRISSAHVIASGGFPGSFRTFYNGLDSLEMGIFQYVANTSKFMRENSELWHNIAFINPSINASESNIYTSAFEQTGRTILHLVNGNYDNSQQVIDQKSDFTVDIELSTAPNNIWMTTPDKISKNRKQTLSYTYENGVAAIDVPELDVHNVIVIEQGSSYDPAYDSLEVKFPFPVPEKIVVNNEFKITAVPTEGNDATFDWYVNDVKGGGSTVGTITQEGVYTAPSSVPSPDTVTIKAVSKLDSNSYNTCSIKIVPEKPIPWTYDFSNDSEGESPSGWQIVEGRGDWKVDIDSSEKVLRNFNMTEGYGNADLWEAALYSPFIVGGDQQWTSYSYSVSVKPNYEPIHYYGDPKSGCIGTVFRYKDKENYYAYIIGDDNKARLMKVKNGGITQIGTAKEVDFIETEQWTDLKVEVYQDNFKLYIDSQLVRDDKDSAFSNGCIGLKPSHVDCMYKNIEVQNVSSFSAGGRETFDTCDDFSYVYEKSNDVGIDTNNSELFEEDSARFYRTSDEDMEQWIKYNIGSRDKAQITAWFWPDEAIDHFKFYISDDNSNWREVVPDIDEIQKIYPDWHKVVYTLDDMSLSAKYLRIDWQNLSGNHWTPQIGQVSVCKESGNTVFNDSADTLGYVASSYDVGIDDTNSSFFDGDSGRFFRMNGSTSEEWIQYGKLTEFDNFETTAYFYPDEPIDHFKFYVSNEGISWSEISPDISTSSGSDDDWDKVEYSLDGISHGNNCFKIKWQNLNGQFWSPQIGDVSVGYTGNNLMLNSGFENDSEFWHLPSNFSVVTEDKYIGMHSLKLSAQGDASYASQGDIRVKLNTDYTLSFFAKCSKPNWVKVLNIIDDSTIAEVQTSGNDVWTKYTLNFNSGDNHTVKLYIGDTGEATGGTLYFDEFKIE